MADLSLLVDLHRRNARLGPGSAETTGLAMTLAGLRKRDGLHVADIGCGTGASALQLARECDAQVMAVDAIPAFLSEVGRRAGEAGLAGRIRTVTASMDALPFAEGSLDAIWSEGAIYLMGFAQGLRAWRPLLRPGGILAVSDLTWLTDTRPAEIEEHWQRAYSQVAGAPAKIAVLEQEGYRLLGYFPLPEACWLEQYWRPLEATFPAFLDRQARAPAAQALVDAERAEIALYERYSAYVSYGFYIAQRVDERPASG